MIKIDDTVLSLMETGRDEFRQIVIDDGAWTDTELRSCKG